MVASQCEEGQGPLAIEGGSPVRHHPLAPWPVFEDDEVAAATAVLRSGKVNYWTGREGRDFEVEYAASLGRRHAVAMANGTLALEAALFALGVGPGDEVITTPRTFIASASCAVMRGAIPVMADVDPDSGNITAETIRAVLTPRSKAIVAVHLAGWPCDMDPILALAKEHGLWVIEDCAQAHGAVYRGRQVGSMGHAAAFSFCQDKIITTAGEGGMLVTDDQGVWERAWSIKDHGKDYATVYEKDHPPGFRWLHERFGSNWRMPEVQAAVGRVQLPKLPRWVAARRANAKLLQDALSAFPSVRVPVPPADVEHAYYRQYAFVCPERLRSGWDRDRIRDAIVAEGVPCFSGSCSEIYLERAFAAATHPVTGQPLGPAARLPNARMLGETSLAFLVHPTLTADDMADACRAVRRVLAAATADTGRR